MKPLSPTQDKVLQHLASKSPAWVIRAGRITTLNALAIIGLIEMRLGSYGWEARITEKGLGVIGTKP